MIYEILAIVISFVLGAATGVFGFIKLIGYDMKNEEEKMYKDAIGRNRWLKRNGMT